MTRSILLAGCALIAALLAGTAHAEGVAGARRNIAGGVNAGAAHDVSGPLGGREVAEGGVVSNGRGDGVGGSRGCARGAGDARGCRSGATSWTQDGAVSHESNAAFRGAFGGTGSSSGSLTRSEDGDWSGQRSAEVNVGDRTYSAQSSFESGEGASRSAQCSGC